MIFTINKHLIRAFTLCLLPPDRRFATVELRAKRLAGSSYVAVPEDDCFLQLLLTELGLSGSKHPFVVKRDDCLYRPRSPAVELHVTGAGKGTLWPVLAISQAPLILACLPLVDASPEQRPPLSSLLSVSQGLSFLAGLQTFLLAPGSKQDGEGLVSRLALLPSVLLQVCPLGTPLELPLSGTLATPSAPTSAGIQKQPAWRTGLHRGRAVVNVSVAETVRSMQYGNRSRQDLWDVYGTVACKVSVQNKRCKSLVVAASLLFYSVDSVKWRVCSQMWRWPSHCHQTVLRCRTSSSIPVSPH